MKVPVLVFLLGCGSFCRLPAQNQSALEFLKSEIQRTARERDEARKKLLEAESISAEKVKILSREQRELLQRLNESSRDLLELEAGTRMSGAAMKRAEKELADRERQLQELRRQQSESQEKFERVTHELSTKLAEAELRALDASGPEATKLAAERERLREEIQVRDVKLGQVEEARQRDITEMFELQQLNRRLTEDLQTSRRSESLANAKLAALESRLGILQQELANQYAERSELEQEQERLQGIIRDLEGRLADAETNRVPREQFEELSATLDAALSENQALREELARRENFKEKFDQANAETRNLSLENRQLRQQLRDEQRIRQRMEKDISDLESVMKEAKSAGIREEDLEDVALLVAEMEREKEAFRKQAMAHRENVDLLQAELDNQQSRQKTQIRDLQQMLGEQLREITASRKKIEALEARSRTLDEVRVQKAQLVKMQERSQSDMRTLAKHIYELRDELVKSRETQRKAVLALQKNHELAEELDRVRAEMERVQRLNQAVLNQDDRQADRIRELRQELETGRAQQQALEREKRMLLRELQNRQYPQQQETP